MDHNQRGEPFTLNKYRTTLHTGSDDLTTSRHMDLWTKAPEIQPRLKTLFHRGY